MAFQSPALFEYSLDGTTYTVAAVGDWLDAPSFDAEQDLFESDGYLAAEGWFMPLGGATGTVSFLVERDHANHPDAQAAFLTPELADGDDLLAATGTLRFTVGGMAWEWADAVLQDVRPALPSGPVSTVATEFRFTVPAAPVEV